MLTILNIEKVKSKEFSSQGCEWILYGVDVSIGEYTFCFIPMEAGRYDVQKSIFVKLNRRLNVTGKYLVESHKGMCYLDSTKLQTWQIFVFEISDKKII